VLPVNVLLVLITEPPKLWIAPPSAPDVFAENVSADSVRFSRLLIAPPELLLAPFVSVKPLIDTDLPPPPLM